jgi:virginiamycin B lyase
VSDLVRVSHFGEQHWAEGREGAVPPMPRVMTGAVVMASLLTACSGDSDDDAGSTTSAAITTTTATSGLPEVQDVDAAGAQAIEAVPFADWVTIAGDSAWVANVGDGVGRFDLETGELLGSVPVSTDICLAMDEGFESLWLGNCADNTLVRVDVVTGEVVAIPLPGSLPRESSVAVGERGVWVLTAGTEPALVRIDPATNEVAETFPAPSEASAVRYGEGSLWVTRARAGQLLRVDPATGEALSEIEVAPNSVFLAVGEGGVWTLGAETAEVSHVDPATDTVVATIPVGEGSITGGDIAVGGGYVWARVSDSLVAQIDPATDEVVARFGPPAGSGSVAADEDAVWISAHDVNTVRRLSLE